MDPTLFGQALEVHRLAAVLEIEVQVKADVVSRGEALPLAAGRIAEGVSDER